MTDLAIDVRGLRKSYSDVEAVRGIDLLVRTGEHTREGRLWGVIAALLGPTGGR